MKNDLAPTALPANVDASFLAALDASPALMWMCDAYLHGTYFNTTWTAFTGRSLEEELSRGWMAGVHPDDLDRIAAYETATKAHQPFETEYRLRRHDGAWRWMLDSGRPWFGPDGRFAGYVGSCIDITDRKETEEARERSDERLRLAQEAAGIGTYDWDVAANTISWTREMFQLYGIDPATPPEGIYAAWLGRLHPEDRERADAETKSLVDAAEDLNITFRIMHPDKGERWIHGRGRMTRDAEGRALRMTGVNFDVTAQRRTEESLRESEQRIRDIAENFPGIIFRRISYPDGRVEYPFFSGFDEAVLNVPRERLEGTQSLEALSKLIHYEDVDELLAKFAHASATLTPLDIEGRVVGQNGEVSWVRSLSRPRPRADGAVIWDGVILNVTEQHLRRAQRERAVTMLQVSMDVAGVGTWEYDPETETIQGSAITNGAFGLPEDATARPLTEYLTTVHPDDVDQVREGILAAGRAGGDIAREYRLVEPTGAEKRISSVGRFTRLADGTQRIIGALSDITAQREQEADREALLRQQDGLLRELNHRVKNNLQLVLALLRLEAIPQAFGAPLNRAIGRVETVADIHGRLSFVTGAGLVDFGEHIRGMCGKLQRSDLAGGGITLHCDAAHCMLDLDRAVPLAVVVDELLGGAVARIAAASGTGEIAVALSCGPAGAWTVIVAGRTVDDQEPAADLNLRFLRGMCSQMGATFEQLEGPAVKHLISFTVQPESA